MFNLNENKNKKLKSNKYIEILVLLNIIIILSIFIGVIIKVNTSNSIEYNDTLWSLNRVMIISICFSFMAYIGSVIYHIITRKKEYLIISCLYLNLMIITIVEILFRISNLGMINSVFRIIVVTATLIIIFSVFSQAIIRSNEKAQLEEELIVFYNIAELNSNDNIILYDSQGSICYVNKLLREKNSSEESIFKQYENLERYWENTGYNIKKLISILNEREFIKTSVELNDIGKVIELYMQKVVIKNHDSYYMVKFNDITDEYNKNKEIENNSKVLTDILDSINDIIVAVDSEGNIVYINNVAAEIIGELDFKNDNINYYDLIINEEHRNLVAKSDKKKLEYTIYDVNKREVKLESFIIEVNEFTYSNISKLIVARDLSKKNEYNNLLMEYYNFKEYEKRKNDFFINLSHEFKTPLNVIFSAIQLFEDGNGNNSKVELIESYNKYKNTLKINCLRMSRIITNMIDMLRLDSDNFNIELSNINIVELVEDVVTYIAGYSRNKNIDLIFDTEFEEIILTCDPNKMVRVITNLLSNSIKFSYENNEVYIKIIIDHNLRIEVIDNGIGISNEMFSEIFKPFSQIDNSLSRENEGSGMGLSISKRLMELQGGDIVVERGRTKGSKFTILIPNEYYKISMSEDFEKYSIDFKDIDTEISDIYELF